MNCKDVKTLQNDFKDGFQDSRTSQGTSKIFADIRGLFKDFKDRSGMKDFKNFFQDMVTLKNTNRAAVHIE